MKAIRYWLLALGVLCGDFPFAAQAAGVGPLLGDKAPEIKLQTLEGKPFELYEFLSREGRPVLLFFYATWCKNCRQVQPKVVRAYEKYAGRLEVVAINIQLRDSLEKALRYKKEHNLPYPVLFDTGNKVTDRYLVFGVPMFVLINPQGIIVYRGYLFPDDLARYLKF